MELFKQFDATELIKRALAEDVGQGDITTAATVAPGAMGRARITVKEPHMILAGGVLIEPVMRQAGAEPRIVKLAPEGAELNVRPRPGLCPRRPRRPPGQLRRFR